MLNMCRMLAGAGDASLASVAPGSMVVVRDEEVQRVITREWTRLKTGQ